MENNLLTDAALAILSGGGPTWAIDRAALDSYISVLQGVRDITSQLQAFEAVQRQSREDDADRKPYKVQDGVAFFEIEGPMLRKSSWMMYYFGGTATVPLREAIRTAAADKDVKFAVLYLHTPGGTVHGLDDLAQDIAAFAAQKPMVAYVSDQCASAGYYVASQCTAVLAGVTAMIGCIGTVSHIDDTSRLYENNGISRTLITNDEATVKGAGTGGVPVTPSMIADMRKVANTYTQHFAVAIGRGRGMDPADVRKMATGQMFDAADALDRGLIDGIMSLDDVMSNLRSGEWPDGIDMAASRGREDNDTMNLLGQIVATLRGNAKTEEEKAAVTALESDVEAKEAAVIEVEQLRIQNAELLQQVAALSTNSAQTEAQSYVMGLVTAGRLTAAESMDAIADYLQASADDTAHGGDRLARFKTRAEKRPAINLTKEMVTAPVTLENGATETVLKLLLPQEVTPDASNRGEHEQNDKPTSGGHTMTAKSMTAAEREAAVKRSKTGIGKL